LTRWACKWSTVLQGCFNHRINCPYIAERMKIDAKHPVQHAHAGFDGAGKQEAPCGSTMQSLTAIRVREIHLEDKNMHHLPRLRVSVRNTAELIHRPLPALPT